MQLSTAFLFVFYAEIAFRQIQSITALLNRDSFETDSY